MTYEDPAPKTFDVALPIVIRPLVEADLPLLEWHGKFLHFRNLFLRSYKDQLKKRRLMLVADCNGYPIGRLFIQFESKQSPMADGTYRAYLYSFFVLEAFQGRGIGNALMEFAEAIMRARGFQEATVAVAKTNLGALRLYERRKYVAFSENEGYWEYRDHEGILHQVHEPCWLMAKPL